jgi:hypothetical protein
MLHGNTKQSMRTRKQLIQAIIISVLLISLAAACSSNENAHTTATTVVLPPPRQVLRVVRIPGDSVPAKPDHPNLHVDPNKPLLVFNLPNGKTLLEGEEVVIDFSLANAKLKGDGGEYRVRYIVDDDEMQWIDRVEKVVLSGWIPGKHTIRLELIGPDGWPYRNGDYNVVTRAISVLK